MWRRAFVVALVLSAGQGGPAAAQCPGLTPETHLVVLDAENPTSRMNGPRTGILVSGSGLILSVLNREPGGIDATDMLNMAVNDLRVNVWSDQVPRQDSAAGVIFGHDARRNLIAIKISDQDVARLGLTEIRFGRLADLPRSRVCIAGFREAGDRLHVASTGDIRAGNGGGIHGVLDHRARHSEMGGAVLDPSDGGLLGIVVEENGDATQFLPIEFADTLMSQVFIGRIMKEMDALVSTSEQVRTAVGWSHHITRQSQRPASLQIRFFFEQYASNLSVRAVRIVTELTGTRDGRPGVNVDGSLDELRDTVVVTPPHANYIEYMADRHFERAVARGFTHIDTIRIELIAQLQSHGDTTPELQSRRTVFELPIDISLVP